MFDKILTVTVMSIVILFGYGIYKKSTAPPSKCSVERKAAIYTIWIGSAAIATGHNVNEYELDDNFISFTAVCGNPVKVPIQKLFKIETKN